LPNLSDDLPFGPSVQEPFVSFERTFFNSRATKNPRRLSD